MNLTSTPLDRLRGFKQVAESSSQALVRGHLTRTGRARRRAVQQWKDVHRGERCVIVGNGPSLNKTDLSLLKGETVFGLNRIYLMHDRLGFAPTYHVVVNRLVVEQCASDFQGLTTPLFTTFANFTDLGGRPDTFFLNSLQRRSFHRRIDHGVWEGMTVTFVAMQIAYYMGFSKVVLIGVDHNFVTKGTPHRAVISGGDDQNHFDPNYFGRGFRWQLPDLDGSEFAYRKAKAAFESSGRRIVDATVDGKLDVFDKVPLIEALASTDRP